MKTAIIKTGFWLDDDVFDLNSDTRLVYLCLLTNPQRDVLPAFRCGDRMMSTYTGYSRELIALCRQQLIDSGRIIYLEGYYIFTKQDYVKPSSGRDTTKIYDREYAKLPESVRNIIENNTLEGTGSSTGTSTGHNNIDIDKHIDINIDKSNMAFQSAKLLAELHTANLRELNWKAKDFTDEQLSKWAIDIDKINRLDGYEWGIITAVIRWCQDDKFWKTNIVSGGKLRSQFPKLVLQAKVQHDNQSSRLVIAGQDNDIQTSN